MPHTDLVQLELDLKLKLRLERVCANLGLSLSEAFTLFAHSVVRERNLPFAEPPDTFYAQSNVRYLEGILQDIKEGRAHFAEHELLEAD